MKKSPRKKPSRSNQRELTRYRTLGRMIPGFVHQFRTPLAVIASSTTNLAETAEFPVRFKPELELIQRSAERLRTSVQNLLNFAKGEEPEWVQESVNIPISRTIDFLKEECRKRNVRLDLRLAAAL